MNWLIDNLAGLPDGVLLICGAVGTALVSLLIAATARAIFVASHIKSLDGQSKLPDFVHASLLTFTVFILALVLADVRSNLGKTDDSVLREASGFTRLDRELQVAGGDEAAEARRALREYAEAVPASDWPALSTSQPKLSAQGEATLRVLIDRVRSAARARPDYAETFRGLVDLLEDSRQTRLENATKSIQHIFWWMIGFFVVGAMIMNGRHQIDRASGSLIALHMAAIGLVIALIFVADQPFRGQTSVSPDPISRALETNSPD